MTTNTVNASAVTPDAPIKCAKASTRISQFRLYRDANRLIPINLMTKTAFVQRAVARAALNPALLGLALNHRASRSPMTADDTQRISITWESVFASNVDALAMLYRMSSEEVVRLCVEAAVYCDVSGVIA